MLEDVLKKYDGQEVSAIEVYSDIFKLGEGYIQKSDIDKKDMRANPVAYYKNNSESKGHYRILFEDTFNETLEEIQEADFAIVNGISYFGRKNTQAAASKMFAMIFDLDGVTDKSLELYIGWAISWERFPLPNYIVLSGHNVHLYYVFEEPIDLYPNIKLQLKSLKYGLIERMWNVDTSVIEKPQYQGINQGFRPIGGKTKIEGVRVRAFRMNTHPVSIEQLNESVLNEDYKIDTNKLWKETKYTLKEAQKLFPEWYQKRVIEQDKSKGHWTCKEDLYNWWIRQIKDGASYHHRYFCIMSLAIYAVKSGISEERVRADAYKLLPLLNDLNRAEPFTETDIESALECFDERYITFPRDDISKVSAIDIEPNKRNYRKMKDHSKYMNAMRKFKIDVGELKVEGRPTKEDIVIEWRRQHPQGYKAQCIKDTGLSKPTVYKYWDKAEKENKKQ